MAGITEDDLTRSWSLAPDDAAKVLRAWGTEHRLRCAVQLCTLRHRFVAYRQVPTTAAQLDLDPLLFLPDPERFASESPAAPHPPASGRHEFDAAAETPLPTLGLS